MQKISLFAFTTLIIATVDSVRNLPANALFGSSLPFFFLLATCCFLLPTALISSELATTFPEKGGIYYWVYRAFGEKSALFAIWLQWCNTMIWFPTMFSFMASTLAYLFDRNLALSPTYIVFMTIFLFWIVTFINLFGLNTSIKINKLCGFIGTILPLCLIIFFGFMWLILGYPSQLHFSRSSTLPIYHNSFSWIALVSIMASFLGMELSGTHIAEMHNPRKNFPKAIFFATLFIVSSTLLGSIAIAIVIPREQISLTAGVAHLFAQFFSAFHINWSLPITIILIFLGSMGMTINWLLAPAKGFLHAAEMGLLPPYFAQKNKFSAPKILLLAQAILVSLFCCLLFFIPTINSFYWLLTALSTELYMIMYILMFASAIRLHYQMIQQTFTIKSIGIWCMAILGFIGSTLTCVVAFFPPEMLHIKIQHYVFYIILGNVIPLVPALLFFFYRKSRKTRQVL